MYVSTRRRLPQMLLFAALVVGALVLVLGAILFGLGLIPPAMVRVLTSLGGALTLVAGIFRISAVRGWLRGIIEGLGLRIVVFVVVLTLATTAIFGTVATLDILGSRPDVNHSQSYIANWSTWDPGGQWSIDRHAQAITNTSANNTLLSEGSAPCCNPGDIGLLAPVAAPADNYALESDIQVLGINATATDGQVYFGVMVRADSDANGDLFGIIDDSPDPHPGVSFYHGIGTTALQLMQAFRLDASSHTYRIEVRGDTLRFLIDGKEMFQVHDAENLQNTGFGLIDSGYRLRISRLSIVALT